MHIIHRLCIEKKLGSAVSDAAFIFSLVNIDGNGAAAKLVTARAVVGLLHPGRCIHLHTTIVAQRAHTHADYLADHSTLLVIRVVITSLVIGNILRRNHYAVSSADDGAHISHLLLVQLMRGTVLTETGSKLVHCIILSAFMAKQKK